ncbi:DUF4351 domain-containing protein [Nostoc sp. FACHB-152]|uniref:DUF4351 domain-containing protein n=1 Tax=unclassified Nostoc TaxID=2593658 RepID=UPI0016867B4D|nr:MULTISPECIES: DUF4351 domain-containing protein [unclassified Nostoc]MBD2448425.1 DUF4351 domain-containing protein [Nostoc sp. FACHB-152]MBD2470865.1 DUF4351 domain-containing protein [Nostoc sp. FACHB-145]
MTRFIHDQFSKDYLEELLKPYGTVQAPSRVAAEVREIDVLFSPIPTQATNLDTLGLLGKMATNSAIFEPFRNPATKDEITDCLLKLLEVKNALQREANRNKTTISDRDIPQLWVLTPTASATIISGFGATLNSDWGEGVYFLPEYLRTAIVVIHQLPTTIETLWLRILGRGKVQQQAIEQLTALPANQPFVRVTLELLYNLQQNLRINQNTEADDQELVMRLAPLYQQDREQARQEGLEQGLQQGEQQLILRQLNRRLGEIDSYLIEQVKKLSIEQLEVLGEALLDFATVTDLEVWLSQQ